LGLEVLLTNHNGAAGEQRVRFQVNPALAALGFSFYFFCRDPVFSTARGASDCIGVFESHSSALLTFVQHPIQSIITIITKATWIREKSNSSRFRLKTSSDKIVGIHDNNVYNS